MELYDFITRVMEVYGMTFDDAFTYFVVVMVGCFSAFGFFLSLCADLGRYLYLGMKKLLRFIIRRFWCR